MHSIRNGRLSDRQVGVLLILPGLAVFAAIILYPFVDAILMSFTDRSMIYPNYSWVGLDNYKKVFQDPYFGKTLWTTVLFVVGSTVLPYVLGMFWAVVLNQGFRRNPGELDRSRHRHWLSVELDFQWSIWHPQQPAQSAGHSGHRHFLAGSAWNCAAVRHHRPDLADASLVHGLFAGRTAKCVSGTGGGRPH